MALLRFWPALIPLIVFLIWYSLNYGKKDIKVYDDFLEKQKRYRFYTLISTFVIFFICALFYSFTRSSNTDDVYVPARIENNHIVPATFEKKQQIDNGR